MPACGFSGNSDMYSLGIRVGFYLQWYSVLLASYLASKCASKGLQSTNESYLALADETNGLRFSNALFVLATFIALVINTARDSSSLQVVEVYIILLLTFGAYAYLVPLQLWRLATRYNPRWDPSRFPSVVTSWMYCLLYYLLLIAVSSFQLWFWFVQVPQLSHTPECPEYGFFFAQIRLNEAAFRGLNIAVHLGIMVSCLVGLRSLLRERGSSEEPQESVVKSALNLSRRYPCI
jgi:hypothetical protein